MDVEAQLSLVASHPFFPPEDHTPIRAETETIGGRPGDRRAGATRWRVVSGSAAVQGGILPPQRGAAALSGADARVQGNVVGGNVGTKTTQHYAKGHERKAR
jgi:hypothetical protein